MRLKSNSCEQGWWGDVSRVIGASQAKHQHKTQAKRQPKTPAQNASSNGGDASRVGGISSIAQAQSASKAPAQNASTKRKPKWGRRVPRRNISIITIDVHNFSRRGDASPPFKLALYACVQN